MDLIYRTVEGTDLGAVRNYEMDLAYGKDENDFTLTVDLDEHCLEKGYMVCMEGTEYGGVIDKIKASNVDDSVTYSGRTWHGILEGKVMEPVGDNDKLLLSGDANDVLRYLIEAWSLTDLFMVPAHKSVVDIVDYRVGYVNGYTGIRRMLYQFGGKPVMKYKDGKVELSAELYKDYSQDEEFDSSQVCFTSEKDYRPLNHVICTGLGDSNEPYVIHLFCDEYKGLQPYSETDTPIQDSDYILTKENQRLFGKDEVTEVSDSGSVQIVKNYVLLNAMPDGWNKSPDTWNDRFPDIYTLDEEGKYKQAEAKERNVYELQTEQPYDWKENYKDYYVIGEVNEEGELEYEHPEFNESDMYTLQTERPSDWQRNYSLYYCLQASFDENGEVIFTYEEVESSSFEEYLLLNQIPERWAEDYANYYVKYFDGLTETYQKVSGVTKYWYEKQTSKPSDWETNYGSYYKKSGDGYVQQEPKYKKETKKPSNWSLKYTKYYQRVSDGTSVTYRQVASVPKDYYEQQTSKPSDWKTNYKSYYYKEGNSYKNVDGGSAPAWKKKKYYTKKSKQVAPSYDSVKPVYGAYPPEWASCPRYTRKSKQAAPEWADNTYYLFAEVFGPPQWKENTYYTSCPAWKANTYYTKLRRIVVPEWSDRMYYRQYLDHYARLIEKGIEFLKKKADSDTLDISLELENIYDINDIVGAAEHITGQSVWMPITKKIIKITDTTETVEYEAGE